LGKAKKDSIMIRNLAEDQNLDKGGLSTAVVENAG